MSKKEQFIKLMKGDDPGRILFYPLLMHFAARFIGKTYGQFASDYNVLVESNIKCMEHFGLDMVGLISDPYRETSAFGAPIEYIAEGVPKCLKHLVESVDDIAKLKNPDVYKCERTLDRINGVELFKRRIKDEVPVMGWVEGPLAEACDLAGVGEMLVFLMTDPDSSKKLMDICLKTAKDFAKAQVEAGCDLIGIGDAICSQIDAETYNTFVFERHKELVDYIHSIGAYVKLHICGDTTHLWPSIAKLDIDWFDPDHLTSISDAHKILGSSVTLSGNLNPVDIQNLKEEEIVIAAKKLAEKEKGKRFIMSAGCEITVLTPHANLMAMRNAIKQN
jgi:MtaA/CmuA family methyltransferase